MALAEVADTRGIARRRPAPRLAIIVEPNAGDIAGVVRVLKSRWEGIKVLVVGVSKREDAALNAFVAGAHGIVVEGESLDGVVLAARRVLADGVYFPPQLISPLIDRLVRLQSGSNSDGVDRPVVRLSARELQILGCFERSLVNKEIAVELGIEVQTVKNEATRLFWKLGVHTRHDAMRMAGSSNLSRRRSA